MEATQAHRLVGVTLENGLQIIEKISKSADETGGNFSVQYIAQESSGVKCFLKAIDIESPIAQGRIIGEDFATLLQRQMELYNFERKLLDRCKTYHTSHVVRARTSGLIYTEGNPIPVPYLTFDLADGNIKRYMKFHGDVDFVWKLKSIHDVFVGVEQLHHADIFHQDLKPSNILQFKDNSKLTDLGRSKCNQIEGPYDEMDYSGDMTYRPIETFEEYSFLQPNVWLDKNLAIDSYMLGNLMVFYFTGLNMTSILTYKLRSLGGALFGTIEERKAYLDRFYNDSIEEIKRSIEYPDYADEIGQIIYELCNPDPNKRADKKTLASRGSNFALHRYMTRIDVLYRRASLKLKSHGSIN